MEREELEKRLIFVGFSKFRKVAGMRSVVDLFTEGERTGIYVLSFKDGSYYVGKATNVVDRFLSHAKEKCKIDALAFKKRKAEEVTAEERRIIAALDSLDVPLRNVTDTPNPNGKAIKAPEESLLTKEIRMRWCDDARWNDLTGTPMDDAKVRAKYAKKFADKQRTECCAHEAKGDIAPTPDQGSWPG